MSKDRLIKTVGNKEVSHGPRINLKSLKERKSLTQVQKYVLKCPGRPEHRVQGSNLLVCTI